MQRISIRPRNNWQSKVEAAGFSFHTLNDIPYWNESAYYEFTEEEILNLEEATATLYAMYWQAAEHVIKNKRLGEIGIPESHWKLIEDSWESDALSLYGRFDLGYDGKNIKLLEFNADTPTGLFEASVIQWFWLTDLLSEKEELKQFNSIDEKLKDSWNYFVQNGNKMFFAGMLTKDEAELNLIEDTVTLGYLAESFYGTGPYEIIDISDISFNGSFFEYNGEKINNCFKLYPWEWMIEEEFGSKSILEKTNVNWIEPIWKLIYSNKGLLPILYELFPYSPYLLKTDFKPLNNNTYVKKQFFSREGANIKIIENNQVIFETGGDYDQGQYIYQEFFKIPSFNGAYPVIGSWVIGGEPAGIGLRESPDLVTGNTSQFVPHLYK